MKHRRSGRILLLLFLLVVLIGVPVWQAMRLIRQERLNRALIAAIKKNQVQVALALLNAGADPNARDAPPDRRSVWQQVWDSLHGRHDSSRENAPTALLVLLEPAAREADYIGQYIPPRREENVVLARALLDRGAEVNVRDAQGDIALLLAAEEDEHQTLLLLLDHGANVNVQDRFGYSPLRFTSEHGDTPAVQRLISKGAQIDAKAVDGQTPLMGAVENQHLDVVCLLLGNAANANLRDTDGETALHIANETSTDQSDIVKLLLAHGADIHIKNNAGKTPLKLAQDHEDTDCIRLLKQAGESKHR